MDIPGVLRPPRGWRHFLTVVALAGLLGQASCSLTSFSETYYAGVVDKTTGALQFYRFEMEGRSGWTNTKFVSGMYSKEAIDAFVGEEMINLVPKSGDKEKKDPSKSAQTTFYTVTGPEGEGEPGDDSGKLLVVIMSSDPEPITKAIGEFAKSKAVTDALEQWAERAAESEAKEKRNLFDRLEEIKSKLESLKTPPDSSEDGVQP